MASIVTVVRFEDLTEYRPMAMPGTRSNATKKPANKATTQAARPKALAKVELQYGRNPQNAKDWRCRGA